MYQGKFEQKNRQITGSGTPLQKCSASTTRHKSPRIGSIVFYTVFFLCIFLFYVATYWGLRELRGWLSRYEMAQPSTKSNEVFDELFANPDWEVLYDLAQTTAYGSKDNFVNLMKSVVGDSKLNYMETSTGLSEDKKYVVRLEREKIATFTLVNHSHGATQADIPDWELGAIAFSVKQESISYRIVNMDGHTVYVNGVPLDDTSTIQISTTQSDAYLPVGTKGTRICTQEVTGLTSVPDVRIVDEKGNATEVKFDNDTRTFIEQTSVNTINDSEWEIATNAIKTYALYMIKQASRADVTKFFLTGSDAYKAITDTELGFVQSAASYNFTNETVTNYCRYSDTLFSVRVSVTLNQHRTNGSVKESVIDQSLFFEKQSSGNWLCYAMTAMDISKSTQQVRLIFKNGDTILQSDFYDASSTQIQCPVIPAPEGKQFSGWMTEGKNENGDTVMNLVFQPDENGKATIPVGVSLEPMTLYPFFESTT